jgi:HEPN domain-containing protein
MECDLALARERIAGADDDLTAAEKLASGDPLFGAAVYHCQLAAEKALKSYLVYLGRDVPQTHDLTILVDFVVLREEAAKRLRPAAEQLTPYGVAYRNAEILDPDRDEFETALAFAYEVHDYVTERMPEIAGA